MNIIEPYYVIETEIDGDRILKNIERYTRVCYKSEGKTTDTSAPDFVRRIYNTRKHKGIIEHEFVTVRFICDRGVSHEIVRHRMASYLQESTRYVNYDNRGMEFIRPPWVELDDPSALDSAWISAMNHAEMYYNTLIRMGWKPEQARSVLPNSLKTEVVCTMNLGSWHHFFELRTAAGAHPQMRQLARPLLDEFKQKIPVIFEDIVYQ